MSDTAKAPVVVIGDIRPHPNAERLELTDVGGYQMVIGKGSFASGDRAVFIQPDSVVPQTEPFKFVWAAHLADPKMCQHKNDKGPTIISHVEEGNTYEVCIKCFARIINGETMLGPRYRRIKPRRLRGEWSEGLLMPITDFQDLVAITNTSFTDYVGQDVAEILGITRWEADFDRLSTSADTAAAPKRRYPKSVKGWFFWALYKMGLRSRAANDALDTGFDFPVYDVDALKNNKWLLEFHDRVRVTEKIHGSNARYVSVDGKLYAGSHRQWKAEGKNVWWQAVTHFPEIEEWCHANSGKVLYGEVGPTQRDFRYGVEQGEPFFFAFDIYDPETKTWEWPGNLGFTQTVPTLGLYDWDDDLLTRLVDGKSLVIGAGHIREGIVIRNLRNRVTLKVVSNEFLTKDGKN